MLLMLSARLTDTVEQVAKNLYYTSSNVLLFVSDSSLRIAIYQQNLFKMTTIVY